MGHEILSFLPLLTVPEACEYTPLGRSKLYELNDAVTPSPNVGFRCLVRISDLESGIEVAARWRRHR